MLQYSASILNTMDMDFLYSSLQIIVIGIVFFMAIILSYLLFGRRCSKCGEKIFFEKFYTIEDEIFCEKCSSKENYEVVFSLNGKEVSYSLSDLEKKTDEKEKKEEKPENKYIVNYINFLIKNPKQIFAVFIAIFLFSAIFISFIPKNYDAIYEKSNTESEKGDSILGNKFPYFSTENKLILILKSDNVKDNKTKNEILEFTKVVGKKANVYSVYFFYEIAIANSLQKLNNYLFLSSDENNYSTIKHFESELLKNNSVIFYLPSLFLSSWNTSDMNLEQRNKISYDFAISQFENVSFLSNDEKNFSNANFVLFYEYWKDTFNNTDFIKMTSSERADYCINKTYNFSVNGNSTNFENSFDNGNSTNFNQNNSTNFENSYNIFSETNNSNLTESNFYERYNSSFAFNIENWDNEISIHNFAIEYYSDKTKFSEDFIEKAYSLGSNYSSEQLKNLTNEIIEKNSLVDYPIQLKDVEKNFISDDSKNMIILIDFSGKNFGSVVGNNGLANSQKTLDGSIIENENSQKNSDRNYKDNNEIKENVKFVKDNLKIFSSDVYLSGDYYEISENVNSTEKNLLTIFAVIIAISFLILFFLTRSIIIPIILTAISLIGFAIYEFLLYAVLKTTPSDYLEIIGTCFLLSIFYLFSIIFILKFRECKYEKSFEKIGIEDNYKDTNSQINWERNSVKNDKSENIKKTFEKNTAKNNNENVKSKSNESLGNLENAISETLKTNGKTISLLSLILFIFFVPFYFSSFEEVKIIAISFLIGIFTAFILTILFLPSLIIFLKGRISYPSSTEFKIDFRKLSSFFIKKASIFIIILLLISSFAFYSILTSSLVKTDEKIFVVVDGIAFYDNVYNKALEIKIYDFTKYTQKIKGVKTISSPIFQNGKFVGEQYLNNANLKEKFEIEQSYNFFAKNKTFVIEIYLKENLNENEKNEIVLKVRNYANEMKLNANVYTTGNIAIQKDNENLMAKNFLFSFILISILIFAVLILYFDSIAISLKLIFATIISSILSLSISIYLTSFSIIEFHIALITTIATIFTINFIFTEKKRIETNSSFYATFLIFAIVFLTMSFYANSKIAFAISVGILFSFVSYLFVMPSFLNLRSKKHD